MPGYTTLAAHHGATNAHDPLARIAGMKEAFRLCRQTRRRVGLYVHAGGENGYAMSLPPGPPSIPILSGVRRSWLTPSGRARYEVRTVREEDEDGDVLAEKEKEKEKEGVGWRYRVKRILRLA